MENSQNNKNMLPNNETVTVETNQHEAVDNADEQITAPVRKFMSYTTAHGMSRFADAQGYLKILWAVFLVATYVGFSVHLSTLVTKFIAKPLLTAYDPDYPYQFPDVYICPKNQVSINRVFANLKEIDFEYYLYYYKRDKKTIPDDLVLADLFMKYKSDTEFMDFKVWDVNNKLSTDYQDITTILNKVEKQLLSYFLTPPDPETNTYCYSLMDKGESYQGNMSQTAKGYNCLNWSLFNASLSGYNNYCRNPSKQRKRPWCYIIYFYHYEKADCGVSICQSSMNLNTCYINSTSTYRGKESIDEFGEQCDNWKNYNVTVPEGSENYCRSPDSDPHRPWCYRGAKKHHCDIPYCSPS